MTNLTGAVSNSPSSRWHYAVVVVVTSVVVLWQLGATVLDGHEAYVASTSGNMANPDSWLNPAVAQGPVPPNTALNHWLIPVFNGEPRLVKTPLAYWCVAGLLKLGLPADELAARLPSALAGIALSVLVLALGRSMFSARAALLGALMLATSLGYVSWGRNARADMQMTFWMSLAMACAYWALERSRGRRRHLLLLAAWGALGLANLSKQLAPLFVILPLCLYLCWQASAVSGDEQTPRRNLIRYLVLAGVGFVACVLVRVMPFLQWWQAAHLSEGVGMAITVAATIGGPAALYAIRSGAWPQARIILPTALPGAVLMLAIFVPWMIYIAHVFPQAGEVFAGQTANRALGTGGWLHRSAAPFTAYYVQALAKWSLPWAVFLPGAVAMPLMTRFREDRNALVFLFLWVFGIVLLFSVSVGKHDQYIIPALPAACLLMGYCAEDVFFTHRWFSLRMARSIITGYGVAIVAAAIAAVIALAIVKPHARPIAVQLLAIAGLALVPSCLALALVRTRPPVALAMMFVSAILAEIGYFTAANPWDNKWDNYALMGRRIRHEVPAGDRIVALGSPDPSLVWYAGRDLPAAGKVEARFVRLGGQDEGHRLWRQWLEESRSLWVVGSDKDANDLEDVRMDQVGSDIPVQDWRLSLFRGRAASVPEVQSRGSNAGKAHDN